MGTDLAKLLAVAGLAQSTNPKSGKFDLDGLNKHNAIEHDASLSRADAFTGDNHSFNSSIFNSVLAQFHGDTITIQDAAKARAMRSLTESKRNRNFEFPLKQFIASNAETALYLAAMGDATSAPVKYVKVFFGKSNISIYSFFFIVV